MDKTPPVISLEGESDMRVPVGGSFADPGYSASDVYDGNLTPGVQVSGTVDESVMATYSLRYTVSDSSGNAAEPVTRLVHVYDANLPVIQLLGEPEMTLEAREDAYTEPGAHAWDAQDGNLPNSAVTISGTVDASRVGDYTISYNAQDSSGNAAPGVVRMVHVRDTRSPVITLLGRSSVQVRVGRRYTDAGATASDAYDGDITANIVVKNAVNTARAGAYYVNYTVADSSGNPAAPATRVVQVLPKAPAEGEGEGEGEAGPVKPKAFAFLGCGADSDASNSGLPYAEWLTMGFCAVVLAVLRQRRKGWQG